MILRWLLVGVKGLSNVDIAVFYETYLGRVWYLILFNVSYMFKKGMCIYYFKLSLKFDNNLPNQIVGEKVHYKRETAQNIN